MSQAGIVDFEAANPNIPTQFNADTSDAIPIANVLDLVGSTVANGLNAKPLSTSGSGNTITIEVQVGTAIIGAPADKNNAGIVSFDDTAFSVDENGYVTLVGGSGPAIDSFTTDLSGPVEPDGSGNVAVTGGQVFSDGSIVNTLRLSVEATANTFLLGAGDNVAMTELGPLTDGQLIIGSTGLAPVAGSLISADGSVTITAGAGTIDLSVAASDDAILTLTGDAGGAVSPTLGNIDIQGVTVANAANAKPVFIQGTPGSSLIEAEIQVGAAITGAPSDKNDAGLVSADDTLFTITEHGYLSSDGTQLGQTITGDSGGALSPTAGNWNIIGSTVANATNAKPLSLTGSGSTLTAEIQVAADITGAPADKNDAGIVSFDDVSFLTDSNGYTKSLSGMSTGWSNLGISYTSGTGTFTIHGYDGTALSSSNPAIVWLPSKSNVGQIKKYTITANQDFIDDNGTSEIINNTFGLTSGVAFTASTLPFYIYAVTNDDEDAIAFMLSRWPHAIRSPASAKIGAPDDAVANTEDSMWSLENIDETLYDSNPVLCIGSFRMTMSTLDDWTVDTIDPDGTIGYDGIGNFNDRTRFTFQVGHNGAASGGFLKDNSGTAPSFTINQYRYLLSKEGECTIFVELTGDGGADGAGAVNTILATPLMIRATNFSSGSSTGFIGSVNSSTTGIVFTRCIFADATNSILLAQTNGTTIKNSDFGNGQRSVQLIALYPVSQIT